MDELLNSNEEIRYSRQLILEGFDRQAQLRLKNAKILCVGAGGLGSPVLQYLTSMGVGTIGIADFDLVELSNLHRQVIFDESDIGLNKALMASIKLKKLNNNVTFVSYPITFDEEKAITLSQNYDLIVDCSDNFATRYLINDICFTTLKIPFVSAAIIGFEGQIAAFIPDHSPCYRCLYPSPPPIELSPNCSDNGVLGVLPGVVGSIQGLEAIKILTGIGNNLSGNFLNVNALNLSFEKYQIDIHPSCPICSKNKGFNQLLRPKLPCLSKIREITPEELKNRVHEVFLIDVRDQIEFTTFNIGGHLIPLSQLGTHFRGIPTDKDLVILCQRGIRSKTAAELLLNAGFTKISLLKGGLEAWKSRFK